MSSETPEPPRKPGLLVRAVTVLFSLLIAVLLAEIALRIAMPARTRHYVWPPSSHATFRPRSDILPDLLPETRFTINSQGLRGPELGRDGDELRVLAFGGSTTECMYQDDAKVWPSRIGPILSEGGAKRVWSGGAGHSGAHSGDHVLQVRYLLEELPHLDVVVLLAGVNDVNVALGMPDTYAPVPTDLNQELHEKAVRKAFMQVPGRLEDAWDYDAPLLKRSQIYQLIKRASRSRTRNLATQHLVDDDRGTGMLRWRENRQKAAHILTELPDLAPALSTFQKNLTTIAELAAKHQSRLILLTQPTLWRDDLTEDEKKLLWMGGVGDYMAGPGHDYYSPGALAEAMRRFNEVTLSLCRDRQITCIDLASSLPKTTEIFYDDCHFGHTGSEKIAQIVASVLAREPPFTK